MKSRKKCLAEILTGVFGVTTIRDVKEKDDSCEGDIIFDKGMFEHCNFTGSYAYRYRKLFLMTFFKSDVKFVRGKPTATEEEFFNRRMAIGNAIEYFKKYQIDLSVRLGDENSEDSLAGFIFDAICCYLIPTIFQAEITKFDKDNNDEAEKQKSVEENIQIQRKNEDIEKYFKSAMERIRLQSAIFTNQWNNIYADDIEKVKDEENERGFNFAIPLDGEKIRSYEWCWVPPNIVFKIKEGGQTKEENTNNIDTAVSDASENAWFNELTSAYSKYPFSPNERFVDIPTRRRVSHFDKIQYDDALWKTREVTVIISNIPVQYPLQNLGRFYFITFLDEHIIKEQYPDVENSEQLDEALAQRAYKVLRRERKEEFQNYYRSIMQNIEDILQRIIRIDLTILVNKDDNIKTCKSMLRIFNFTEEQVEDFFLAVPNNETQEERIEEVYNLIESAIIRFNDMLDVVTEILVKEYNYFFEGINLESHAEKIKKIMNSEKWKAIIECQENMNNNISDEEKSIKKFQYQKLLNTLSRYYDYLTGEHPLPSQISRPNPSIICLDDFWDWIK